MFRRKLTSSSQFTNSAPSAGRNARNPRTATARGAQRARRVIWTRGLPGSRPPARRFYCRFASLDFDLALTTLRRDDALRTEDRHQHEDDAEDHALVLGGLELGREIRERIAEDHDARVLQLVEPEAQALQDLEVQHGHHGRAE